MAFHRDQTHWIIDYNVESDLLPEHQAQLLLALEAHSKQGTNRLIFRLSNSIDSVPAAVPIFWLKATEREDLHIEAMAIVTQSPLVRVATSGFAMSNILRNRETLVKSFVTEAEAKAWLAKIP